MLVYHFADTKTEFSGNDTYLGTLAFQCFQHGNRFRKKERVDSHVCICFLYIFFLYSANVSGVVIPLKILNESSSVFPMVRFMASSLMPVCPWRSSTLRKQITMPREESASV